MTHDAPDRDKLLSLTDLSRQPWAPQGRRGRPIVFSTWLRWVLDGARALDGTRVKLLATRVGGKWSTSRANVEAFFARLGQAPAPGAPAPQSAGQRQRSSAKAQATLAKALS